MIRRLVVSGLLLLSVTATGAAAQSRPATLPPEPPAVGEERVTPIDLGPCDEIRRHPSFRIGQDQVIRRGEALHHFATVLGNVVIEGHVCGDLSVTLGDVRLGPEASIEGSLVVVAGTVTVAQGARIDGELVLVGGTLDAPADFRPGRDQVVIGVPILGTQLRGAVPYFTRGLMLGRLIVPDLTWIWGVVAVVFFVQLLLNLLFPQATASATRVVGERPLSTFLAGLLVLVLSLPVAALLTVTVIGIAALPVLFGALLIAWVIGKIAVLRWIGTRLYEPDEPDARLGSVVAFTIGFVVLTITYMIPLLGIVAWGLTGVLGLGAAAMAFVRGFRQENPPVVRTPPPPIAPPPTYEPPPGPGAPPVADAYQRSAMPDGFQAAAPAFAGDVPPVPPTAAAAQDTRALLAFPRAAFTERAAAFLLDAVLVALAVTTLIGHDPDDVIVPWLVVYHVAFWAWKSTTIGGIVCQLRVVRVDGAPLRVVDCLVRGLVGIFSLGAFGIGALWILRDPERQSWHDKVAGTFVVRVPRHYPVP